MLDKDRLKAIVDELDKGIPRSGAFVKIEVQEFEEHHSTLIANELGYLRLGVELLKAGVADQVKARFTDTGALRDVQIDDLITFDSNINFGRLEKRDDLYSGPEATWLQNAAGVTFVLLLMIVFVVGMVQSCRIVVGL